ncbi:phosphatidylserine/phosphatidylglycerophosphate/cardiolipin synthase family protein [Streptomyces sp. NPDC001381]|uniref:phospholipase D-like domain-containing protein n=1 Tax=Streptomyces sp. NPDC001381 TaxID=3364567 RepID=UPI00368B4B43
MLVASRFRPRKSATVLSALLLATGLQAMNAPEAAAALPEISTVFNDPDGTTQEQQAIRLRILSLVDSAAMDSEITVALYHMWDETIARALAAAHTERGVRVRVLLDSTSVSSNPSNPSYGILRDALGTDRTQSSFVGLCPQGRACLGDPANGASINHNKFFLFSQVDGASNLVVQTSSNLTPSQYSRMANDAVLLQNTGIYTAYRSYFGKLAAQDWDSWSYTTATFSPYKAYFYPYVPGTGNSSDTIWNILDEVTCTWTEGGTTLRSKVRVAVLKITRQGVADKLVALKKAGCDVQIVYAESDSAASTGSPGTWETLHTAGGPTVRCYNHDEDNDSTTTNSTVHSKYLLIDGKYAGTVNKLVWTGSHNYSGPALRENDEALLKIDNTAVHDQYAANFSAVTAAAVPGTADDTPACKGV